MIRIYAIMNSKGEFLKRSRHGGYGPDAQRKPGSIKVYETRAAAEREISRSGEDDLEVVAFKEWRD